MKNLLRRTSLFRQVFHGCGRMYGRCFARTSFFVAVKGCVSRQHQVLFGVGVFFLLCWIIASLWLINMQREESGSEEILERQAAISMLLPEKMVDKS